MLFRSSLCIDETSIGSDCGSDNDGGVHSHTNHLYELIKLASKHNLKSYVHAFTDGRDVDPKSSYNDIKKLENFINDKKTHLASVTGRYYAMDRDNRWERTKLAYDAIINGQGVKTKNITKEIHLNYSNNCTDEFLRLNDFFMKIGRAHV